MKWLKWWVREVLESDLNSTELGVLGRMVCLAGEHDGREIYVTKRIPYTDEQLAGLFYIPVKEWLEIRNSFEAKPRKMITLKYLKGNTYPIISINSWEKYNPDWERIKGYDSQKYKTPTGTPTKIPTKKPTKIHNPHKIRQDKIRKEDIRTDKNKDILAIMVKLKEVILFNKPKALIKESWYNSWYDKIRLMIQRDGRTISDIYIKLEILKGHSFWGKNILSAANFREHFDRFEHEQPSKKKSDYLEREKQAGSGYKFKGKS